MPIVEVAADMPAPLGGGLRDYVGQLTAATRYTGAGGSAGPTAQMVSEKRTCTRHVCDVTSGTDDHATIVRVDEGTSLDLVETCGANSFQGELAQFTRGYTATDTEITLYNQATGLALTYTYQ